MSGYFFLNCIFFLSLLFDDVLSWKLIFALFYFFLIPRIESAVDAEGLKEDHDHSHDHDHDHHHHHHHHGHEHEHEHEHGTCLYEPILVAFHAVFV